MHVSTIRNDGSFILSMLILSRRFFRCSAALSISFAHIFDFHLNKIIHASVFGKVLLPSLAGFCFRVWQGFASEFGRLLFPCLAGFYFRVWRSFTSEFGWFSPPHLISTPSFSRISPVARQRRVWACEHRNWRDQCKPGFGQVVLRAQNLNNGRAPGVFS